MALKKGTVRDFSNSMANAIETAFRAEWNNTKEIPLTSIGTEDRKILFAAIAQGVLNYLHAHQAEIGTTRRIGDPVEHTHVVNFHIE